MSNVIAFIEKMGQDAQLRHASQQDVQHALACADIEPGLQAAILAMDQDKLMRMLGGNITCCMFFSENTDEDENEFYIEKCA